MMITELINYSKFKLTYIIYYMNLYMQGAMLPSMTCHPVWSPSLLPLAANCSFSFRFFSAMYSWYHPRRRQMRPRFSEGCLASECISLRAHEGSL